MTRDRPSRVLLVNTSDRGGGAERVAWALFTEMEARGMDVWMGVGLKRTDHPRVREIPLAIGPWGRSWEAAWRYVHRRKERSLALTILGRAFKALAVPGLLASWWKGREGGPYPGSQLLLEKFPVPDLIHFHNLHGGYLDIGALPALSRKVPSVVTLHDDWLYTGHCASAMGCERWRQGCGACPDLTRYPQIRVDATRANLRWKKRVLEEARPHLVALCRWSRERVEEARLPCSGLRVIPNGVDLGVFRPVPKEEARGKMGLPLSETVILFSGAAHQSKGEPRAVPEVLGQLGSRADLGHVRALVLGQGHVGPQSFGKVKVAVLPRRETPEEMALCYAAADLYVHPSKGDTFPLSTLEAMACGTPVVASRVGGIPEQVEDGVTGRLVGQGDFSGMARAIHDLLKDPRSLGAMAREAVRKAKERFDLHEQVEAHLRYYREILEGERVKRASSGEVEG